MNGLPARAEVVIIGGGVIGLSVAYHLARRGAADVVLLERHRLTSGTSWHAAGVVGPLRASMNLTRLSVYATELFVSLEAETGQSTGYRRTGGLWLAQTAERLTELKRTAALGEIAGLEAAVIGPSEVAARLPLLETGDLQGALWVEQDGQANPVDLCMAYAKGARQGGVRIFEDTPVRRVRSVAGAVHAVELEDGGAIRCAKVINCAGAWAAELGRRSGVAVPLQAVEHMYVVTEPVAGLPRPCPIVRDLDARIYIKEDAGKLVLGGFEPDAKLFTPDASGPDAPFLMLPEDWDQFEPFMAAGLVRLPALAEVGIQQFMNGPESFTPDTRQLMGEVPNCHGHFVAAGFNSIGIVSSAGAGRVMADWMLDGAPPMDLWEVDIARFEADMATPQFLAARVQEAAAGQFEMHWPFKQPRTGRGLRHTPLHRALAAQGAVFGAPAGWERPLWFAAAAGEVEWRYSYGDQDWWPSAEREALAAREAAVLIDLSPFGKFEVAGNGACAALQRLCANDVDIAPGRLVYTQVLNPRGGIEADLTVTRLGEDRYWLVGPAPTRQRDLGTLSRALADEDRLELRDISRDFAVLGLMGPRAPEILSRAAGHGLSGTNCPFGSSAEIAIAGVPVRASRVSYIGEFGWELYIPWRDAAVVHDALCAAGAPLGVAPMGMFAVDACRLEKGFRHWGHDIGPDDTPLEAGLGFAVAWDKPGGFTGLDALLRQRDEGVTRRLLQFRVEDGQPLLLHDEPIYRDGRLVGRTTSGARGFRTGLTLCLGYVDCAPGEGLRDLRAGRYEVAVAGERFALSALARPPYDPQGARMRQDPGETP